MPDICVKISALGCCTKQSVKNSDRHIEVFVTSTAVKMEIEDMVYLVIVYSSNIARMYRNQ